MKQKKTGSFSIRGLKGFRRMANGKIECQKSINGKRYWSSFDKELDAYHWKKNFHPLLNPNPERNPVSHRTGGALQLRGQHFGQEESNGRNYEVTFGEVWEFYLTSHLATKEIHTQYNNKRTAKNFYGPLMAMRMADINRFSISNLIAEKKAEVLRCPLKSSHRYNFNNELKKLSTLLNWYSKNFDEHFRNPICDLHRNQGFIRAKKPVRKKMSSTELIRFLEAIREVPHGEFWADMAETQLYLSARIGEIGGLQWDMVNFAEGTIEISKVAVYIKKRFYALKDYTKNGENRVLNMNQRLQEILSRRFLDKNISDGFVFHINGMPPSKQRIDQAYNKAFKLAGLPYRGTHCLRHTMANLVRGHLSLEHAKALGGWKSSKVVELIYTDAPAKLKQESVDCIENVLRLERLKKVF